jgi:hypothetical protein
VEPLILLPGAAGIRWVARDLKPPIFQQAAELYARGLSVREVRKALGIFPWRSGPPSAKGGR